MLYINKYNLQDWENNIYWEEWSNIKVGDAASGYKWHLSTRNNNSTLGNRRGRNMDLHNHMKFTTYTIEIKI